MEACRSCFSSACSRFISRSRTFAYTVYDDQREKWIAAKVTLISNPLHGLPTPADESLFLALFNLAIERDHLASDRLEFTPHSIFKIMGKDTNVRSYNQLIKSLERLTAVKVHCEYSWFDVDKHAIETKYIFGLLADAKLHRPKQSKKKPPKHEVLVDKKKMKSYIVFDPEIYRQLTSGTLKPIDLDFYFSLKRPISRRMYRTLDRFFYRRNDYSSDVHNFTHGNLGMSDQYNNGEIKSKLQPAIDELVLRNFIQPADKSERYTKIKPGIWRINFTKTPKHRAKKPQPKQLPSITTQLTDRRITPDVAQQLADNYEAQRINTHIEIYDWYQSRGESKSPGFLLKSIEDNYSTPKGFKSTAQRAAQQKTKLAQRSKSQQDNLRQDRLKQHRSKFYAYWDKRWSALSTDGRTKIYEAVAADNSQTVAQLKRYKSTPSQCLDELARRSADDSTVPANLTYDATRQIEQSATA